MKKIALSVVIIFIVTSLNIDLLAQCPMCRMAAESNLENGGTAGKGLNTGILYIFVMPYLIIGTIGFLWFKNRKSTSLDDHGANTSSIG